jgi:hypothetical protein
MELSSQAFGAAAEYGCGLQFSQSRHLLSYLVCSHACHVKSPANNAAVPPADSGREK